MDGELNRLIQYVPTEEQVADILTKPILKEKHETLVKEMRLV
jgi:hypothetical protein